MEAKPTWIPMAQGYMELEYIPGHVGATWYSLNESGQLVESPVYHLPFYQWPRTEDIPKDQRDVLYWNSWSLSGITAPNLIRFEDIQSKETYAVEPNKYMIGVWGTNSYRTVITNTHDDESDINEIP